MMMFSSKLRLLSRTLLSAALALPCCLMLSVPPASMGGGGEDRKRHLDPVRALEKRIALRAVSLEYDPVHGYVPSLLEAFGIPVSSQTLVFSKTSLQFRMISPDRPRAIYFNDDIYAGTIPGSPLIEVSAADPLHGGVFYTLRQHPEALPEFRGSGECIQCHESHRTDGVPGHLVRSVYPQRDGQPVFHAGTFDTDDRSPFEERWGGWYVTGSHGAMRHMGNAIVGQDAEMNREEGANVTDLSGRFDPARYLSPHSDIVALMVLGHQVRMHNLIARARLEAVKAIEYKRTMTRSFGEASEELTASTKRRIERPADDLVRYLLFKGEAPLEDRVRGTSEFAEEFAARGPFDSKGRSLREFDLESRLFRYPCSFLIYSEAFDALPEPSREYVYRRLWEVLNAAPGGDEFGHLSRTDRQAILEILRETKPGLPGYFGAED